MVTLTRLLALFKMKEKEGLLSILKLTGLIEIVNVAFYKSIELLKFSKLPICKT